MTNDEKLIESFASSLGVEKHIISDSLEYNSISQWDSIAHMGLVAELEGKFDVMLDTDQVIGMSSVAKAKEILGEHGISFSA